MGELKLGVSMSARGWRQELQRHVFNHANGVDIIVIRDARVALESNAIHILLVDPDCIWLTPTVASKLRANGVKILLAFDTDDGDAETLLADRLGVTATIAANAGADAILSLCWDHAPIALHVPDHIPDDPTPRPKIGRVIAVGGPAGAGRSEIALLLATGLGQRNQRTLLIDADEFAPSVAERLQLPRHPNLVSALDLLRGDGDQHAIGDIAIGKSLAHRASRGDAARPFDVLTGMAARGDWILLRDDLVAELLDAGLTRWQTVVADVAPTLETSDRWASDRYPASRRIVTNADEIVLVMNPSPSGIAHGLRWLVDAFDASPFGSIHVVCNRMPRDRFVRAEIERELVAVTKSSIAGLWFVPHDRKIPVAAWNGELVGRSRAARALDPLIDRLAVGHTSPDAPDRPDPDVDGRSELVGA